jgi:hypothetical protein
MLELYEWNVLPNPHIGCAEIVIAGASIHCV